jgi:hypothetical protein
MTSLTLVERSWPLIGRDEQLRTVAAAIRAGAAGIVVAGPAGVGKTRLVREILAAPAGRRVTVAWAHGSTAARPDGAGRFFADFAKSVPADRPAQDSMAAILSVTKRHGVAIAGA